MTATALEWNTIIRCSPPHRALSIYVHSMLPSGAVPNKFTFTFLLRAAITHALGTVRHLHSHLTKLGLHTDPFLLSSLITAYSHSRDLRTIQAIALPPHRQHHRDVVVATAIVSAYARCGLPDAAREAFDEMPHRNSISWAALISSYTRAGRYEEALDAFLCMRQAGTVEPTEAALVSALTSCARLGALLHGRRIHHFIIVRGLYPLTLMGYSRIIGTGLVAMYAKCGRIDEAVKVFDGMQDKDQPACAAMISALASHGRGEEALSLFDRMLVLGYIPDNATWVIVLNACSHAGLVDKAREYFDGMVRVYKAEPGLEHYGCLVDALGRGRRVEEAWEVVRMMPVEPDKRVLNALLSASCAHGPHIRCAEWAAERLVELDMAQTSAYVMLSNAYAQMGRWEDVARVRMLMRRRGIPKAPGSSAV